MKLKSILSIVAIAAAITGNSQALTPVSEKFKGKKLDNIRWYQYNSSSGKLATSKGKLNYVVSKKPTSGDYASIELLTSQPGFNESWEMTIDLGNKSNAGHNAGCGFMLFNVDDRRDHLYVESFGKSGIAGGVLVDDKHGKDRSFAIKTGVAKGSIRVRFDKTTKLLTFDVSLVPASKGYDWKKIGTLSVSGKGGDINANWKMNPGSGRFGVQLFGFSNEISVPAGKVTLDNFSLTARP